MVKTKEKGCSSCQVAVAIGTSLRVCKILGDKKECKTLMDKVVNEEITPDEVFSIVRKMAKGHAEELEIMDMVDKFVKEAKSGKTKRKKTRKSK